jgi:hypothetical protein
VNNRPSFGTGLPNALVFVAQSVQMKLVSVSKHQSMEAYARRNAELKFHIYTRR